MPHSQGLYNNSYSEPTTQFPSSRSILVLSSHLCLGLPKGLFLKSLLPSSILATCPDHHFLQKLFGRKCFIVRNHFLKNWFAPKIFIKHFLGHNLLLFAKSFPRKRICTKTFHQKFFGRKFFIVAKSFPRKQFSTKNF